MSHTLLLDVHRTFRKTGKKIDITVSKSRIFFNVYVLLYIYTYVFLKLFSIMGYYKTLTIVPCVHRFLYRHMFLFLLGIYLGIELVGHMVTLGFPGGSDGKVSACNAGDPGSIPGSGRSPGEGNGNPRQYSCLENSMD